MSSDPSRAEALVSKIQVFEPHKASLPPMGPYLREFWRRRRFAVELARFTDKAEHLDSPLGSVWLVLNPLLLAMIYFLLVTIIGGRGSAGSSRFDVLAHILVGLFTWYFAQNCMTFGGASVTAGGKLILNQAFPRALLPLSSLIGAFQKFIPTLPVYLIIYLIGGALDSKSKLPGLNWHLLWIPVMVALVAISGFGLALLFATMNVYFRDTSKLMTYGARMWLYLSPVLWMPDMIHGWHRILIWANPLGPILSITNTVWIKGENPSWTLWLGATGWAFGLLLIGGYFFVSRERDFAVRI
ncbi:MAG: ABC transporter permease [Actinobacteria bacterium]|nr:ABC transporter permease [Actinomycetota bacterium]